MRKACGLDGLFAEHLKFGGQAVFTWLLNILNCVIELEAIPDILKGGSITPVYKGGGKDPLDKNNYRGITVASVLAKVLESLILERLNIVLLEAGVPHVNQTAYRRHVGCTDTIFATQETIARHVREGSTIHMCLYDLQKAFDSVEFPVLLDRLFSIGVNGKTWRIIKDWYEGGSWRVKLEDRFSNAFLVQRGVRQGSVLSPALFLLVMDPLLNKLESASLGLKINDLFVGGFAHADDIRTITNSTSSLNAQLEAVSLFTSENFLQLNPSKCEIVSFSRQSRNSQPQLSLDGAVIPCNEGAKCLGYIGSQTLTTQHHAKCLGYWWSWDLSASKAIDEAIKRARRAFFAFGAIGAFNGKLNPISSRTIFDVCVIPILLYGSENWILTTPLLDRLEAFQGEIGRRILKLSKFHSLLSTRLALRWPSVAARIFNQKLNLLFKINSEEDSIGCHIFSKLAAKDPQSLRIIQECRYLEDRVECHGATDTLRPV